MTNARELANLVGGTLTNLTSGTNNVALGDEALEAVTSGANNVGIGKDAGTAITTADNNTAAGHRALTSNTTGAGNTAVGKDAGYYTTTGSDNSYVGVAAGPNVAASTGSNNTALGRSALRANTTGVYNVALGGIGQDNRSVLHSNTTGGYNVAVGNQALSTNTTGDYNTAIGYQALNLATTADNNTAVGLNSLYANTTGYDNTAVGTSSAAAITTGYSNTFIGKTAGSTVTTGAANTIVGRYDGNQGGLDIRTSSNNIVLSDGAGTYHIYINSFGDKVMRGSGVTAAGIGNGTSSGSYFGNAGDFYSSRATSSNSIHMRFYNTNGQVGNIATNGSATAYNTSSDYRLKENVVYDWDATTRLKQLKPARFNFIANPKTTVDGFLAHEAQLVVPEAVTGTQDGVEVWDEADDLPDDVSVGDNKLDANGNTVPDMQAIDQSKLVPLLVKTIQELEARITALEG